VLLNPYPKMTALWDEAGRVVLRPTGGYASAEPADSVLCLHLEFATMSAESGPAKLAPTAFFAGSSVQWAYDRWVEDSRLVVVSSDEADRLWAEYEAASKP